jgi:hypothetical protein
MEKPKITDYEFIYGCIDDPIERPCETCESERARYDRDIELWEAQQTQQVEQSKQDDNFWMVAGGPTAPRNRHITYDSAHNEAKRLAEKHPGTTFYVVRPITKILAEPPKAASTTLAFGTTK